MMPAGMLHNGQVSGGEKQKKKTAETYLKFDGNTVIRTPLTTLGYPYTMSFDVYLDGYRKEYERILSCSPVMTGRLQLAGINGSLSLNRDYFNQSFEYQVERIKSTGSRS